TALIVRSSHP
ncbi:unnamed protein product, partial [Allacma fusca]